MLAVEAALATTAAASSILERRRCRGSARGRGRRGLEGPSGGRCGAAEMPRVGNNASLDGWIGCCVDLDVNECVEYVAGLAWIIMDLDQWVDLVVFGSGHSHEFECVSECEV